MQIFEYLLWAVFAVVMSAMLVVAVVVVVSGTRAHRRFTAEQRLAEALGPDAIPAEAAVIDVQRSPILVSAGGSGGQTMLAIQLTLALQPPAPTSTVVLDTMIDELLMSRFLAPDARVHVLIDPENPARVAIDRARTMLELPVAAR